MKFLAVAGEYEYGVLASDETARSIVWSPVWLWAVETVGVERGTVLPVGWEGVVNDWCGIRNIRTGEITVAHEGHQADEADLLKTLTMLDDA